MNRQLQVTWILGKFLKLTSEAAPSQHDQHDSRTAWAFLFFAREGLNCLIVLFICARESWTVHPLHKQKNTGPVSLTNHICLTVFCAVQSFFIYMLSSHVLHFLTHCIGNYCKLVFQFSFQYLHKTQLKLISISSE